jgi:hypothetical protein
MFFPAGDRPRRPFASHHRQPQLRVLLDRTRASRFVHTTPQSHKNRPMVWFSSSSPRLSKKTSLPWRSPSIIESRTFDIAGERFEEWKGARADPDARSPCTLWKA